jgi:mRNA-degrading endonuclease toxin of MazEF toxin-antitoxin module
VRPQTPPSGPTTAGSRPSQRRPSSRARPASPRPGGLSDNSPGRFGPDATLEVDPRSVGKVRMTYSPVHDGDPDPGEVVWTWVPFQENDGQGKDRPVLVVAAEPSGTVLVVQLTRRDHEGQSEFVPVGAGDWDGQHRESWVNLERVLRVHTRGMRREAASLPEPAFHKVAQRLRARYEWS